MMNPTELDTRVMSHAARVKHADQFGSLYPAARWESSRPRAFVALLRLRLPARLAPRQSRPSAASDTAIA